MEKIQYIDDDIQCGIKYDYKKIKKTLNKLNIIPMDCYNPCNSPMGNNMWHVILSERSRGKTTNIILYGMVVNRMYGSTIEYIRQTKDEIKPSVTGELFNTILEHDYISVITNGEYNAVYYKWGKWYYALKDDKGEIITKSEYHFMSMLSIDKAYDYKSGYNAPRGDIIIYDEMLTKKYIQPDFIDICDLIKTIARDRLSIQIFLLANMIDKSNDIFEDLMINDFIQNMKTGDNEIVTTEKGTKIHIELLETDISKLPKRKLLQNKLLFGFNNPKLISITGGDWQIENYAHIKKCDDIIDLMPVGLYIKYKNNLIRLRPVLANGVKLVYCTKATKTYDDSFILSLDSSDNNNSYYGLGKELYFMKSIISMFNNKRFRYSTNLIGDLVCKYFFNC